MYISLFILINLGSSETRVAPDYPECWSFPLFTPQMVLFYLFPFLNMCRKESRTRVSKTSVMVPDFATNAGFLPCLHTGVNSFFTSVIDILSSFSYSALSVNKLQRDYPEKRWFVCTCSYMVYSSKMLLHKLFWGGGEKKISHFSSI